MQSHTMRESTVITMTTPTTTRVASPEVELRCVLEGGMVQYVMTTGTMRMHPLSAINWDSPDMVSMYTSSVVVLSFDLSLSLSPSLSLSVLLL